VKIFDEIEGLERRLYREFRTQPIIEGVGGPSQHHGGGGETKKKKEQEEV